MALVDYFISIIISCVLGLAGFIIAYKIVNQMIPEVSIAEELKNNNISVAVFIAGLFIGLGILVGGAIQ